MIIKVTVNDNDFSGIMDSFMHNFYPNVVCLNEDEPIDKFIALNEVRYLLNPNTDAEWDEVAQHKIESAIKDAFASYIKHEPSDEQEYLKNSLDIDFLDSLTDEWQNGENFYWFQHSGTVVNL